MQRVNLLVHRIGSRASDLSECSKEARNDSRTPFLQPHSAILRADRKLLHFYEDEWYEMYEPSSDPGEQNDLASERSEEAAVLDQTLLNALEGMNARFPSRK